MDWFHNADARAWTRVWSYVGKGVHEQQRDGKFVHAVFEGIADDIAQST